MRSLTVEEFIKEVEGKGFDVDKAYGIQCVDGIKKFVDMIYGESNFNCGSCGYAYGLYTNYGTNGVEKYFDKLDFSEAKLGDWIIWDKGSKEAPYSHVAMYIDKARTRVKAFGQNQNGKKYFNYCNISMDGILGVLRPKVYITIEVKKENKEDKKIDEELLNLVRRTIRGDFGNGENRKRILGDRYSEVQNQVNKNLNDNNTNWDNIRLY